jgi:hypothetical protein
MNRSPLGAFLFIPLVLGWFGLSQTAQAVCQEGCLTNDNTVLGDDALLNNTDGFNTAIGFSALKNNTDGSYNTAIGFDALLNNTGSIDGDGSYNMAIGAQALFSNTTGSENTATGYAALEHNTTGDFNTATGLLALFSNTTGYSNTAIGSNALQSNTTGSANIALGASAGFNLTTGDNNIDIGNAGVPGESGAIRIGRRQTQRATFIAGISGATVPTGVSVIVDANGHLGTIVSSQRFKTAIKPMEEASESILALKPVTFHYKQEIDPEGIPQFGLVAEQVEKVNPDLVARDADGKVYTVRYEAVNAMLLNEFLKEHRKVEEQQDTIAQLKAADAKQEENISALTKLVKAQAAQIQKVKAQAAQIQKVSAQVEINKTASQIVLNNQ